MKWKKIVSGILTCAMVLSSAVSAAPVTVTAAENAVGGGKNQTNEEIVVVSKDLYIKGWSGNVGDSYGTKNVLAVKNEHAGEDDIANYGQVSEGILMGQTGVDDPAISFLEFDLSELRSKEDNFQKAKLRLYLAGHRSESDHNQQDSLRIAVVPSESITSLDNSMTYNAMQTSLAGTSNLFQLAGQSDEYSFGGAETWSGTYNASEYDTASKALLGTCVEIDITDAVRTAIGNSSQTALILAMNESQNKEHYIVSKEGATALTNAEESWAPSIVLDYTEAALSAPSISYTAPVAGEYPMPAKVLVGDANSTHHESIHDWSGNELELESKRGSS